MTLLRAFKELNRKFMVRVEADNERFPDLDSHYLAVNPPTAPVDYVLIGSEPSLIGVKEYLETGIHNFPGCPRCEPLHYVVDRYLSDSNRNYHLTDLAKGAVAGGPGKESVQRYDLWFDLLKEELRLVAKPNAVIISFGIHAGYYLMRKGLSGHVGMIPHYSTRNRYWYNFRACHQPEWKRFDKDVVQLPNGTNIKAGVKTWMFGYSNTLPRFRRGGDIHWQETIVNGEHSQIVERLNPCWNCDEAT